MNDTLDSTILEIASHGLIPLIEKLNEEKSKLKIKNFERFSPQLFRSLEEKQKFLSECASNFLMFGEIPLPSDQTNYIAIQLYFEECKTPQFEMHIYTKIMERDNTAFVRYEIEQLLQTKISDLYFSTFKYPISHCAIYYVQNEWEVSKSSEETIRKTAPRKGVTSDYGLLSELFSPLPSSFILKLIRENNGKNFDEVNIIMKKLALSTAEFQHRSMSEIGHVDDLDISFLWNLDKVKNMLKFIGERDRVDISIIKNVLIQYNSILQHNPKQLSFSMTFGDVSSLAVLEIGNDPEKIIYARYETLSNYLVFNGDRLITFGAPELDYFIITEYYRLVLQKSNFLEDDVNDLLLTFHTQYLNYFLNVNRHLKGTDWLPVFKDDAFSHLCLFFARLLLAEKFTNILEYYFHS